MKCTHVCAAQKAYKLFNKLYTKPDFPSLVDEIAESHPDMNIKVTAFTVSEKSSNTIRKAEPLSKPYYACHPEVHETKTQKNKRAT